jgi:hypothetical protein
MIREMSLPATSVDHDGELNTNDSLTQFNSNFNVTPITTSSINVFTSSVTETLDGEKKDILEVTILCIKGLIFVSIIIGAVLGNALVIISVHKNRKLR